MILMEHRRSEGKYTVPLISLQHAQDFEVQELTWGKVYAAILLILDEHGCPRMIGFLNRGLLHKITNVGTSLCG
jgi:hypothetical protein